MSIAFGVSQSDGRGTTARDIRKLIQYEWEKPGIIGGLEVEGRSTNQYFISAGAAICCKNMSDGFSKAYWPGGMVTAPELKSGTKRIDAIWIKANDQNEGDANSEVIVGVSSKESYTATEKPSVPSDSTVIAYMLVPENAISLQNAVLYGSYNVTHLSTAADSDYHARTSLVTPTSVNPVVNDDYFVDWSCKNGIVFFDFSWNNDGQVMWLDKYIPREYLPEKTIYAPYTKYSRYEAGYAGTVYIPGRNNSDKQIRFTSCGGCMVGNVSWAKV